MNTGTCMHLLAFTFFLFWGGCGGGEGAGAGGVGGGGAAWRGVVVLL